MAVTADTVQVRLEAQVSKYLSDLRAAGSQSDKTAAQMARAANTAAAAITQQASAALAAVRSQGDASREQVKAAQATLNKARATEQATRAEVARVTALRAEAAALNSTGAAAQGAASKVQVATTQVDASAASAQSSFSGVAAQFQDIGVTAAAGMNPLLIALQQGTQLSAQLQQSAAKGQGVFKSLATGVAGLINPISIATITTIALGTAAVQYFGTLVSELGPSNESLKEQNDRIRAVADRWGEAVPALKAYIDLQDAAADADDLEKAYDSAIVQEFDRLRKDVLPGLTAEFALSVGELQQMGASVEEITELQRAFGDLIARVRDGSATSADLNRVLGVLSDTTGADLAPSMANLRNILQGVTTSLDSAANAAQRLSAEREKLTQFGPDATGFFATQDFVAEQQRLNGLTAQQLSLENEISRVKAQAEREGAVALTDTEALAQATANLAAEERRRLEARAMSSGAQAAEKIDQEREAVVQLIEELEYEYSLIGLSNEERAVSNALRQAGAIATDVQRARVEELTRATLEEQTALEEVNRVSQEWADTIQNATRGFIDDLIAGKDAAEAFSNVLSNIANKLIDMGLNSLFGSTGFNVAGLFGGTPTRAMGGSVYAGTPTLVGERGPELFIPSGPGKIVPNSQVNGGGSVVFSPQIDARGADVAAVARLERAVQDMASQIVPTIRREIAVGPKKGR